jgi:hypothetical protein
MCVVDRMCHMSKANLRDMRDEQVTNDTCACVMFVRCIRLLNLDFGQASYKMEMQ